MVVGTVWSGAGAPGRKVPASLAWTACTCSTRRMRMAWLGHPCTQAGASPPPSRSEHMSHLRTIPRDWAVFGRVVRAHEGAVLAADTLVIEVADDAGDRVLLVRLHRAAAETGRIHAVVTGGGDGLLGGMESRAAVQKADRAPHLGSRPDHSGCGRPPRTPCNRCRRRGPPRRRIAGPVKDARVESGRGRCGHGRVSPPRRDGGQNVRLRSDPAARAAAPAPARDRSTERKGPASGASCGRWGSGHPRCGARHGLPQGTRPAT